MDHLLNDKDGGVAEQEEGGDYQDRLEALAQFQTECVLHAMRCM